MSKLTRAHLPGLIAANDFLQTIAGFEQVQLDRMIAEASTAPEEPATKLTRLRASLKRHEESAAYWGRFAAKETQRANAAERKLAASDQELGERLSSWLAENDPSGLDWCDSRHIDQLIAVIRGSEDER